MLIVLFKSLALDSQNQCGNIDSIIIGKNYQNADFIADLLSLIFVHQMLKVRF